MNNRILSMLRRQVITLNNLLLTSFVVLVIAIASNLIGTVLFPGLSPSHNSMKAVSYRQNLQSGSWEIKTLNPKDGFSRVTFSSDQIGWIVGNRTNLYRTSDSGISWQPQFLPLPTDSRINDILCIDDMEAWIAVSKTTSDYFNLSGDKTWILATKDKGVSWAVKYTQIGQRIDKLSLDKSKEIWAVGTRFRHTETIYQEYLVIKSSNLRSEWLDLSDKLTELQPCSKISDFIVDVNLENNGNLSLLSIRHKLFTFTPEQNRFSVVDHLFDEKVAAIKILPIGKSGNWILSGLDGTSGIYSYLSNIADTIEAQRRNKKSGTYFSDVIAISEKALLACGSNIALPVQLPNRSYKGTIMYSDDNGESWSTIYESDESEAINSIAATSKYLWAVGNKGLVVRRLIE